MGRTKRKPRGDFYVYDMESDCFRGDGDGNVSLCGGEHVAPFPSVEVAATWARDNPEQFTTAGPFLVCRVVAEIKREFRVLTRRQ